MMQEQQNTPNEIVILGRIEITKNMHDLNKRVYSDKGIAPTICGVGRGGQYEPKIVVKVEKTNE